ncbi:hypothetical protein FRB95_014090 [Tulasnella sp. JGI-2019a]|nr:hypothetical protein FRB93_000530 [Tulasnella sp. JGI-2019a]KAG9033887.1 hypothetical protein FRB95_014090 [Tulasnella sp. JGI-2019a]
MFFPTIVHPVYFPTTNRPEPRTQYSPSQPKTTSCAPISKGHGRDGAFDLPPPWGKRPISIPSSQSSSSSSFRWRKHSQVLRVKLRQEVSAIRQRFRGNKSK